MIRKILLTLFTFMTILAVAWPDGSVSAAQAEFSVPTRWITITSPNGGEVLTVGSTYRIRWNSSSNINRVSIGYKSCDSCLDWIMTNIPNVGFYDWNVSVGSTNKTQFKIQVIGYQTGVGSVTDYSDANFTINPRPTPTSTATKTRTPTKTPTNTKTPTPTKTSTNTKTPTITKTSTNTNTPTVTNTPTWTPTDVPTDTPTMTPTPVLLPLGNGTGLVGEYFDNYMDINGAPLYAQLDPQVYFNWNAPVAENVPDDFTVRWTGQIEARSSEEYVFSVDADDLVRVWIDGQIYIDDWDNPQGGLLFGPAISLARGQKYDIQVDFRDIGGGASISLYWYTLSNSIGWEVVPMQQLYPSAGGLPATATFTPTEMPTNTPSETPTETPSSTPTATATRTITATRTPTRTLTVTPTLTSTFTRTATKTVTPTFTRTPTRTATPTIPTSTQTFTETPTLTMVSPSAVSSWITVSAPNGGEVLNYGDIYSITWQSSSDIDSVDILIGYRYTCSGCSTDWNLEWSVGLVPNTGSYDWSVYVDDPTNKEFIILLQGERFNGSGYDVVALDESNTPFTVELSNVATATQTFTPTPASLVFMNTNNDSRALFGYSLNTAGDVNGDGFDDVLIGARDYWEGQANEGAAFLYFGSASIVDTNSDWSVQANQASAGMGQSVDTAGDVNGDGFDDILVGAMQYSMGEQGEGVVFAYYGSANGPDTTADWTGQGNQAGGNYGWSVSGAGDVNHDGYDDVIVGARNQDNGQTNEGRAYLYLGSPTGLDSSPSWIGEIDEPNAGFGYTVSNAGDVNGDGYDDVLITSYNYVFDQINGGKAYLFMGGPSGLGSTASWIGESNFTMDGYGYDGSTAGDVNGDGYDDILIGAPATDNSILEGSAYLYLGSIEGPGVEPDWVVQDGAILTSFGQSLSSAGDFNHDGYDDVVVGDENQETVFLYLGSVDGPNTIPDQSYVDDSAGSALGAAGDVDNDGYDDFLIGAATWNSFDGRALLYFGRQMSNPVPVPTASNPPVHTQTATSTITSSVTPTIAPSSTPTPTYTLTRTPTNTRTPTSTQTQTQTYTSTPSPSCSLIFINRTRFVADRFEARVINNNMASAYLTNTILSWTPSPLTTPQYFDYAQFGSVYYDPITNIVDEPVNVLSVVPDLPIVGNGTQISWIANFNTTSFYGTWSISLNFSFPGWGDCNVSGTVTNFTPTPTHTYTPSDTPASVSTFTVTPSLTLTYTPTYTLFPSD